jgi:hypothetical protein
MISRKIHPIAIQVMVNPCSVLNAIIHHLDYIPHCGFSFRPIYQMLAKSHHTVSHD